MKAVKTISDPEAFKLFADETRRKIVFLLRAKEMTVSQIADELHITPQTVYHHIKKLVGGDMVEVTREVRVDHLIESYYRATAEAFHFTVGKTSHSAKALKERTETALEALKKIGFKVQYDEKTLSKLVELQTEMEECCGPQKVEEALSKLEDIDPLTKMTVEEYAGLILTSAEELAKENVIRKKFWNLLKSIAKK
jgi:DNA-binding transcriptional ArsR family regulator